MVLAPRPTPGSGMQARPERVPEAGFEARAQEVAALERQYYASPRGDAGRQLARG
jgi:hypothetical protein